MRARGILIAAAAALAVAGGVVLIGHHGHSPPPRLERAAGAPRTSTTAATATTTVESTSTTGTSRRTKPTSVRTTVTRAGTAPTAGRSTPPPAVAPGNGPRPVPAPIDGVTIDDVSTISDVVAGAEAFGHFPTTRVVLDYGGTSNTEYADAVRQLAPHSYVMAELLDSSDMPQAQDDPSAEHNRIAGYLSDLGRYVDIWEVGNEVNGDWTCAANPCDSAGYKAGADMTVAAYQQVSAAGYPAALTLYYNPGCPSDPGEPDPITYTNTFFTSPTATQMRSGLRYVLLSYYETQCDNQRPSAGALAGYLQQLHSLYPNAQVGFGEVGLPNEIGKCGPGCYDARRYPSATAQAESIIKYYCGLDPGLSYYAGGCFWWYYAEDALPYRGNAIWQAINAAFA
ncbi:MAG: hypothetical protein JO176_07890 [Acidimicrobiia bacterium]|nr:hypothetical protein [Acidimicrobiia bacterium]